MGEGNYKLSMALIILEMPLRQLALWLYSSVGKMNILRRRQQNRRQKRDEERKWSYMLNGKQDLQAKSEENVRKKGVVKVVNCHREVS